MSFDKGREESEQYARDIAAKEGAREAAKAVAAEAAGRGIVTEERLATAMEGLGRSIVEGLRNTQGRKIIPYGAQKQTNKFGPEGRELDRPYFQNGVPMHAHQMYDAEIELLKLIKPGNYIDGLVFVQEAIDRATHSAGIYISYDEATADQRMALGGRLTGPGKTGLERLLRLIVDEQEATAARIKAQRRQEVEDALA